MAASALKVQPQVAQAHDVTGARHRHAAANAARFFELFTDLSPALASGRS
jgi:hypothetical protein